MAAAPRSAAPLMLLAVLLLGVAARARAADAAAGPCLGSFCRPQQLHLSHGAPGSSGTSRMVATWSTMNLTAPMEVQYGIQHLSFKAPATQTVFVDPGSGRRQFIHRATLDSLRPGATYVYRAGNDVSGWSALYSFVAQRASPVPADDPLRFVVYGDMGDANSQSMARVQDELVEGRVDAIVHIGDYAYDLFTDEGKVGDRFLNDIEPIAATVGYMGCVGNHESEPILQPGTNNTYVHTFANYKARFSFPGSSNNMWYSWNVGQVHFVFFSTEVYFYESQQELIPQQYAWLEQDLAQANRERDERPWVITVGHRPPYCSNNNTDDCTNTTYSKIRDGLLVNGSYKFGIADLFHNGGVDLSYWAHEHSYERLVSGFYRGAVQPSKYPAYVNPPASVHLTAGAAGCREHHDPFPREQPFYSAFRSDDYGYGVLTVHNATNLHWVQKDERGRPIDELDLRVETHGPRPAFPPLQPPPGSEHVDEWANPVHLVRGNNM